MNTEHPIGDPQELAALFAAGSLAQEEAAEFRRHVDAGCAVCAAALRSYDAVVNNLMEELPPVPPPPELRAKILAAAQSHAIGRPDVKSDPPEQVWKVWSSDSNAEDLIIRQAASSGWEETGVPGVRVRRLAVDRARNQLTALIRMAPGSSYPCHVHDGPEECLVLEGDLRAGDHLFHAGDYQRMAPGTHHGVQSTEGGCLLLIVSSLSDELE